MFTEITLRNYKSLYDFHAIFTRNKNNPKNMIVIYGENGIGKSSFVESFYTLSELFNTRKLRDRLSAFSSEELIFLKEKGLLDKYFGISHIIKEVKSVSSSDNIYMEYDFLIQNNNKGFYSIELGDDGIVSEKLNFAINKKIVTVFQLDKSNRIIHESLFCDKQYQMYIEDNLDKYWGKHSFMAILNYELEEKNTEYIKNNISKYLLDIMDFFNSVTIKLKKGNYGELGYLGVYDGLLDDYDKGTINIGEEYKLEKTENLISKYFKMISKDIVGAFYSKEEPNEGKIKYNLFLRKRIYDKEVNIDYKKESTGIQNLLTLLPYFISAIKGNVVIIDEIDAGIHDIVIEKLILKLYEDLKYSGQVFITTHNTMLMESNIPRDLLYLLKYENGKKQLIPCNEIIRVQKNNNLRKKYIEGEMGGVPSLDNLNLRNLNNNN